LAVIKNILLVVVLLELTVRPRKGPIVLAPGSVIKEKDIHLGSGVEHLIFLSEVLV